jgi:hypothetical protein
VRVTDVFVTNQSRGDLGQQRMANQTELNDCPVGGTRAEALIHYG